MSSDESKQVYGDGPINSRTVKRHELGPSPTEKIGAQTAQQLERLQTRLAHIIQQAQQAGVSEHFTADDHMYVLESMRRYVPDSLEAYLAIAKKHRSMALPQSTETATSLLTQQLQLIDAKLARSEKKLGLAASELLLRQQRFWEIKAKS